ncbi:MAG: conjugal transfer protein TraB [Candidatus Diapherotrites archaeon]|uniref:Conjugal transfer protein TraB n=1 Tax=Candidatus Iainarchaeum sp. TaxID=3101447 RepID=A0A2D6LQC5_9ARCH|nr:conjugal transfer protein TraB [Candidatus Diapherotrites archaeon]|tara:strand:+ start:7937 stop:9088 length:1152 start_codon:yes stop_codon:yes gene_type:complete
MLERVKLKDKEIVLLGTAHISQESVNDVKKAIEKEKPDVVGVELDLQRFKQLKQGNKWQNTNIGKIIGSGQTYLFLLTLLLSNIQRSLGQKIGMKPGMEMIEAIKSAEENMLPIVLLDREVNITLKRAIQKMSFREKLKLFFSIVSGFFGDENVKVTSESIEKLKQKDVMTQLMQQLSKEMPSIKEVLVDERDAFIANSITKSPGKKVLAVVGAGHLEGIKKLLGKPVNIAEISKVKKGKGYMKIFAFIIPLLFIASLAYLFFTKGTEVTLTAILFWFLANGILSSLGVLIARGHPVSIITAFLAAPLTSLHPFLAAGWVAGFVEAKMKNPKVKDFENLRNLNSLGDFTQNQVTRILLVVALANLGSTLGTIVAFPLIASLLG